MDAVVSSFYPKSHTNLHAARLLQAAEGISRQRSTVFEVHYKRQRVLCVFKHTTRAAPCLRKELGAPTLETGMHTESGSWELCFTLSFLSKGQGRTSRRPHSSLLVNLRCSFIISTMVEETSRTVSRQSACWLAALLGSLLYERDGPYRRPRPRMLEPKRPQQRRGWPRSTERELGKRFLRFLS